MKTLVVGGYILLSPLFMKAQIAQAGDAQTLSNRPIAFVSTGTIPSGIIPEACKTIVNRSSLLDCYLNDSSNQQIASVISWSFPNQGGLLYWKQWPVSAKNDLNTAFLNTIAWYNGGMQTYAGTLVADPPDDLYALQLAQGQGGNTILDGPTAAWPIYIGHVALNLAAEIYGWVPWSLHNYDSGALSVQFNSIYEFWYCGDTYPAYPNGFCPVQWATPENAVSTFKFLKTNNLIGPTRLDTIGRILDWERINLWHMGNALTYVNFYNYFYYWGAPPVSRVLAGTMTTDPNAPYFWGTPHHWTAGCFGSTAFSSWLFKAANVPADAMAVGYHQAPWFPGEKLYLSHGDDPYDALSKGEFPTTRLLVDETTFKTWFPANDVNAANKNVGRRPIELNVTYPTPYLLNLYCGDIANAKDHASGDVYNKIFKPFYTVQQLESLGLWTRLDLKMQTFACAM